MIYLYARKKAPARCRCFNSIDFLSTEELTQIGQKTSENVDTIEY